MVAAGASDRHEVVGEKTGAELQPSDPSIAVDRPGEGKRPDQVRRDPEQRLPLPDGFVDEMEPALLEISYAAMDEA